MPPVTDLILASASRYRAELLERGGFRVEVDPPEVDERQLDHLLDDEGPEALALALAHRKADVVVGRHRAGIVVAGDQVGVLDARDGLSLLTKQPTPEGAAAQLLALSGTTHRLVNGLVVVDVASGRRVDGLDVQVVTMRTLDVAEVDDYVTRFRPFDTAGSYRIEDGAHLDRPFVADVAGEDPSGVVGLPLPLLGRLLSELTDGGASSTAPRSR
jgi:septum formation protein